MGVFIRTILLGAIEGSVYALAATGIVLTYKTSGILNFGYGSLAMFTTFVYWQFTAMWGWPLWLSAFLVVVIVAPMIGLFLDNQLFSRIQGQPMVIGVIATVGLTVLLQGVVFLIWGAQPRAVESIFPQQTFRLPGGINIGTDDLAIGIVAGGAAILLAVVFRYTRVGVSFRAVVDNRSVAGLMAINTPMVSGMAWAIGTAFAAVTGILLSPRLLLDPNFLPFFVIAQVLGAAIVGYLRSLPLAYAGGLIVGITQALIVQYANFEGILRYVKDAVPFIIITVAVLAAPRARRIASLGASFVVHTREVAEASSLVARTAVGGVVFGGLALVPLLAADAPSWTIAMTRGMVMSIVFLSIVILTGYSGQISLGHTAFMGLAAYTAAHLVSGAGWPVWAAFVAGSLAAIPAGAVVGVIAVRLHGLFLALMTLALAFMAQALFFNDVGISGGLSGKPMPRPPAFESNESFYYLTLLTFALCAVLAVNLRNGRTGRVLAAMRDSETGARALGINVAKYKVVIFSLSAWMAGLGALLGGMQNLTIGQRDFIPFLSLFYVTLAVVGGIFHVGGAIASGLLFGLYPQVFGNVDLLQRLQLILFGLGSTLALANNPEGLFGELRRGAAAIRSLWHRRRAARAVPLPVSGGRE